MALKTGFPWALFCRAGVLLTFRPYGNPYLDNGILGRDACVVAGIMNLIGSHDVTIQVGDYAHERDDRA